MGAAASLQAQALHVAVLFSSVAALVGYPRHADYAAANAGLDLLGRAWQAAGAPCTSVQWGVWSAVGMASRGAAAARMERLGIDLGSMAPAVGLAALERVAVRRAREEAAVVCATRGAYWDALLAAAANQVVPELFSEVVRGTPAAAAKALAGRREEAPRALQASAVQAQLQGLAGSLLGKEVAADAPLMEQGLDSLGVVELRNAVGRELGLHLNPTAVLDYPTVAALAGHVMAELAGAARSSQGASGSWRAEPALGSAPPLEVWGEPRPRRAAQADVATVLSAAAQLPAPAGGASAAHQDAVSCIPWGRWDADELDRLMQLLEGGRTLQEPSLRMAAMLPAVGMFDGAAFGTSSAEAVLMDPQQRVLLQVAWEALQGASGAAGLTEAALAGAGAYVGVQQMEYNHLMVRHKAAQSPWMATGVALSVVAGRLSYTYGLRGEAVSVDTACSASLVGLHLAGQGLRLRGGSCLTAGVNLTLLGESTRVAQLAGMLSGDARCKTLDAAADGYVRGEACECLVLSDSAGLQGAERSAAARRAGALLVGGTAANQDGRASSLTAPSGPAQQAVIAAALGDASTRAGCVAGLQLHGTGTALGDPIEIGAAAQVVLQGRGAGPEGVVSVTAVKAMVGHSEAAAGLAGLLQSGLQMEQAASLPVQHMRSCNPLIGGVLAGGSRDGASGRAAARMHVARAPAGRPAGAEAREAAWGTSAFAFQGTNAHAVLRLSEAGGCGHAAGAGSSRWRGATWAMRLEWISSQPFGVLCGSADPSGPSRVPGLRFEVRGMALRAAEPWSQAAEAAFACARAAAAGARAAAEAALVGAVNAGPTLGPSTRASGERSFVCFLGPAGSLSVALGGVPAEGALALDAQVGLLRPPAARKGVAASPGASKGLRAAGAPAWALALQGQRRRRSAAACGRAGAAWAASREEGPGLGLSMALGPALQGARAGSCAPSSGGRAPARAVGATGAALVWGWPGEGAPGTAAWPRGDAWWQCAGWAAGSLLQAPGWRAGEPVALVRGVSVGAVTRAPGGVARSAQSSEVQRRVAHAYSTAWLASLPGPRPEAPLAPRRRARGGWRGIAGGVRSSAATLAVLQALQRGGSRLRLALTLQWQCGRPAGACSGLGACRTARGAGAGMLAGAVVPALAETAALEAGMSVRLDFSEEPEAAAGGPLPEVLWPGAQAAVGAVGAVGAAGEESDPGARGVGAFRSGRSAGLRLRPVLRRVWSGVPPASSGAEPPRDAMRAEACPLAVVG